MFNVYPDRIDGTAALDGLRAEDASVEGEQACLALWLSADHDIELCFPAPGGAVAPEWLARAADVLTHLAAMDNHVQRASVEEYARHGHRSDAYEGALAYLTLTGPDAVVLHYWAVHVNSEWDERFVRVGDAWRPANPA